jgi:protein-S-isoprenylcysteine O-methyltransferase Ste14
MNFIPYIILVCWAVFLLYWFVSSFSTKPTQERSWTTNNFRWVLIAFALVLIALEHLGLFSYLHLPSCQLTWRGCHYSLGNLVGQSSLPEQLMSLVFMVAGLIIAIVARKTLSDNWSGNIEIKKGHELVTNGIYGSIRHPIYTGVLLMALGTLIFSQTLLMLLFFLFMFVFFVFKFTQEEKLLTKHFPKEYQAYKKRTKALIPFII